jgi:predicted dehydrogenase
MKEDRMSQALRVGIIGVGTIAQVSHIPYILDDDQRFRLVALCDVNNSLLGEIGDHYHVDALYTDYVEMIEREDIDAVVICQSGSHRDQVLAAIETGKHVMVEKPIAWNLREASEIVARVEKSDRIVQVGYHKLYDPAFSVAKREVESIDDLGYARISVLHPMAEFGHSHIRIRRGNGRVEEGPIVPASWDKQLAGFDESLAGGNLAPLVDEALGDRKENAELRRFFGTLNGSLIHSIYMMFGLLGDPECVRTVELWRDSMSFQILVEYSPDLCCCLEWHHLPYLKDYREEYCFYGNTKRVSLRFPAPYLLHFPSPICVQELDGETKVEKQIIVSHDEAYRRELRAFYECVRTETEPIANVRQALSHSRFIQEIVDKARS